MFFIVVPGLHAGTEKKETELQEKIPCETV